MFRKTFTISIAAVLLGTGIAPALATASLTLTFETSDTNFVQVDFDGSNSQLSSLVSGTGSDTTRVLKVVRGTASWAGTTIISDPTKALITADSKLVTAKVNSPVAGVKLMIKVENRSDVTQSVESYATETTVVGWHEYTFDFAVQRPGTEAFSSNKTYNMASIFLDYTLSDNAVSTAGLTYFVDDVTFQAAAASGNGNGGGSTPPAATLTKLTFESDDGVGILAAADASPSHPQGVFGGGVGTLSQTPPAGGSGNALAILKSGQAWTGVNALVDTTGTVRFTDGTHSKVFFDFYSAKDSSPLAVQLFVGDANVQATTTVRLGWNKVAIDFSQVAGWSSSTVYNKLVIFPDFLVPVSNPAQTYYLDNLVVNGSAPLVFAPTTTVNATLSGTVLKVGSKLSLNKGTWLAGAPITYSYSWFRCSAKVVSAGAALPTGSCKVIARQVSSSYKLVATDRGKYVLGVVKATNTFGTGYSATRSITGKVK